MNRLSAEKRIELAIQVHLAHYDAIRREIETELKRENDFTNFAVAIVAGSITLFTVEKSFVVIGRYPLILLIASMLLSAMCWSLLSMEMRLHDYRKYIHTILKKKVETLLGKGGVPEYTVLGIEFAELFSKQIPRTGFRAFLFYGHFLIIFIPDILFLGAFLSLRSPNTFYEYLLLVLAVLMATAVPIGIYVNSAFVAGYYKGKDSL